MDRRGLTGLVFLLVCEVVFGDVLVRWDPNTENDLSGYRVYYGITSGDYSWSVWVGNTTQVSLPVCGEEAGEYFYAVTAVDFAGNESDFSDERGIFVNDVVKCGQGPGSGGGADTRLPSQPAVKLEKGNMPVLSYEITAVSDEVMVDGVWRINGNGQGNEAGIVIRSTNDFPITRVAFDARIEGSGDCVTQERYFDVASFKKNKTGQNWFGFSFEFLPNSVYEVFINYWDDCWVSGQSDANLWIRNLVVE